MKITKKIKEALKKEPKDEAPQETAPQEETETTEVPIGKEATQEDKELLELNKEFREKYDKHIGPGDFIKSPEEHQAGDYRNSLFKAEVCKLLFAIYCEIKKLQKKD